MDFKKINILTAIIKNDSNKLFNDFKPYFEQDFDQTLNWLVKKKYKGRFLTQFQVFWNSNIPVHYANKLFRSKFRIHLLRHYFKQLYYHNRSKTVKPCSPFRTDISLLQKVSEIIPNDLIQVIKVGQFFLIDDHFKSFGSFESSSNTELQMFYKVCEAFRQFHHQHEQTKRKFDKLIEKTAVEDLLIHLSLFVEKVKWLHKYKDYHAYTRQIMFLPHVMSSILQRKFKMNRKFTPKYRTEDEFDQALLRTLTDKSNNPEKYEVFENLFAFYDSLHTWNSKYLNTFCYDKNYKSLVREDNCLELSPIDINKHHDWMKIGKKYQYMLEYYSIKSLSALSTIEELKGAEIEYPGDTEDHRLMNKIAQQKSFSQAFMLDDYCVLNTIEPTLGKRINPYLLIHYMELFSANLRNRFTEQVESMYHQTKLDYLECILLVMVKQTTQLQIKTAPVRVNAFAEFKRMMLGMQSGKNNILHYKFEAITTEEEITNTLDFYLLDFNKIKSPNQIQLQTNPIIKIGNLCYSIPSLLSYTNITSMLLNKLLPNSKRAKERNQETEQMAINLAKLFELREFKAIAEFELKGKNGLSLTDIDCAAYKDGVLFLIELKSTYLRTSQKESLDNEYAMNKAGQQLQKVENYIKNNFEVIKDELDIDKSLDEIQLYPLIVSTSFEQDYQCFNGYRKISLFELNIILNNEKNLLFLTEFHQRKLIEKYHPNFDINRMFNSSNTNNEVLENIIEDIMGNLNPYENSFYPINDRCSPKYVIDAIEKDKVWDFLDDEEYPKFTDLHDILVLDDGKKYNQHYHKFKEGLDAQYKEGNIKKSMELVEQALELYPNDDKYLVLRGDNHARQGNLLKSIVDLKKATEINPQNETAHCNLALSYYELGDIQNAIKYINQSVALNRNNQVALMNRVEIRISAGLMRTAIEKDLKRVIAINPNSELGLKAKIMLGQLGQF